MSHAGQSLCGPPHSQGRPAPPRSATARPASLSRPDLAVLLGKKARVVSLPKHLLVGTKNYYNTAATYIAHNDVTNALYVSIVVAGMLDNAGASEQPM